MPRKPQGTKDQIIQHVSDFLENYKNMINDTLCDQASDDLNEIKRLIGYAEDLSEEFKESFRILDARDFELYKDFKMRDKEELQEEFLNASDCKLVLMLNDGTRIAETTEFEYDF